MFDREQAKKELAKRRVELRDKLTKDIKGFIRKQVTEALNSAILDGRGIFQLRVPADRGSGMASGVTAELIAAGYEVDSQKKAAEMMGQVCVLEYILTVHIDSRSKVV